MDEHEEEDRLTPEQAVQAMRALAARENKKVAHNYGVLLKQLMKHAGRRGIDRRKEDNFLAAALAAMEEDADRGALQVEAGRKGGLRSIKVTPELEKTLRDEVEALHGKNPRLSWTAACEGVGARYGVTGKTVRRYTEDLKWSLT